MWLALPLAVMRHYNRVMNIFLIEFVINGFMTANVKTNHSLM